MDLINGLLHCHDPFPFLEGLGTNSKVQFRTDVGVELLSDRLNLGGDGSLRHFDDLDFGPMTDLVIVFGSESFGMKQIKIKTE